MRACEVPCSQGRQSSVRPPTSWRGQRIEPPAYCRAPRGVPAWPGWTALRQAVPGAKALQPTSLPRGGRATVSSVIRCHGVFCRIVAAVLLPVLLAMPAALASREAALCDRAAAHAAASTGVPPEVLHAITRVETGRHRNGTLQPWPWTVNMEGDGRWFETRAALLAYVDRHMARGARSFDLGCFQINYRWHGHAFVSVDEMTDPEASALYAAHFLGDLYAETGDWTAAAGAYHSRTPVHARRYRARFTEVLAGLRDLGGAMTAPAAASAPVAPAPRVGQPFPLFARGTGPGSPGSLVPAGVTAARPLFQTGG